MSYSTLVRRAHHPSSFSGTSSPTARKIQGRRKQEARKIQGRFKEEGRKKKASQSPMHPCGFSAARVLYGGSDGPPLLPLVAEAIKFKAKQ